MTPGESRMKTARDEGYYWKEIVGAALWVALAIWLLRGDGLDLLREWTEIVRPTAFPPEGGESGHR